MRLADLPTALLRRWYLTLGGILCVVVGCVYAFHLTPPTYEAKASVLLLPPKSSLKDGANPLLYLGGLSQPAEVLAKYLSSSGPEETFSAANPGASYEVALDVSSTNGPILAITVESESPESTDSALASVLTAVPDALQALEQSASVPDGSSIGTMTLARDLESTPVTKDTIRLVGAVAAAGMVFVVLFVAGLDALLTRRRSRRDGRLSAPDNSTLGDFDRATPSLSPSNQRDHRRPTRLRLPDTSSGIGPVSVGAKSSTRAVKVPREDD